MHFFVLALEGVCFSVPSHSTGYSAGWSLNAGEGLYKNRAFSLESLDILLLSGAKKLDFNLEFTAQGVSLLVWGKCVSGLRFSSFHS